MLSTASAGSPATMCTTAAFRSTERCLITSSIRAVAMPARCSRRNGWPASTERSCRLSPTRTSRATPSGSRIRCRSRICTVPTIEDSSTTTTVSRKVSRARSISFSEAVPSAIAP